LLCQAQSHQFDDGSAPGESLLRGVFPTARGLLAIECFESRHLEQLAFTLGYPPLVAGAEREAHIRNRLQSRPALEWQVVLLARGVAVSAVAEDLCEVPKDPRLQAYLSSQTYTRVNAPWSFT
ncbi:MAG: carnitine dehydratase, partial [Pseudomonas gingeri]